MAPRLIFAALISATLCVPPALAQSGDSQNGKSTPDPKACAPNERLQQGERGPQPPATTGQGESTSDKLARTEGVICPPNLDRDIQAPTPETGKMPVVPPPGSPGGDPNVRPK